VFDWARADSWQTDIPFTALENYLTTLSAHGVLYPVLPVWNSTWAIGANQYRNQALLYNQARGGWDLVYQYDYAATDAQQKTGWTGSWAPIVETFQSLYIQTNPMGALGAQLIGSDNNGVWGSFRLRIRMFEPIMSDLNRCSSIPISPSSSTADPPLAGGEKAPCRSTLRRSRL
jgi:hypothetical protein